VVVGQPHTTGIGPDNTLEGKVRNLDETARRMLVG
jgi:hypothetical protein